MAERDQSDAERSHSAPCERLAWDSEFFGVETARVKGDTLTPERIAEIDGWCARNKVALLYFLARSDDAPTARCAERAGFALVDVRVTYERSMDGEEQPGSNVGVFAASDLAALLDIARQSYLHSRFYYDGRIPREKCDALFEAWTAQTCSGDADQVLVAREGALPVGYVTCHVDTPTSGEIGLIGVAPAARGKGVGARLVQAALAWAKNQGLANMTVVTQGRNIAAQRLYQRCGFILRSQQLYYHKWYE